MRRLTLGVLALVLVLGAVWWFAGTPTAEAPRPSTSLPAETPAEAVPAKTGAPQQAAHDSAAPARTAAATEQLPGNETLHVRAIDAATGEPVAGATILYQSHRVDLAQLPDDERELLRTDLDLWLERHGAPPVLTDADGRARLVNAMPNQAVTARTDRLYGGCWTGIDPDEQGVYVIRLEPDWTLQFRIVDHDDRPVADADLFARAIEGPPGQQPRMDRRGPTDGDGRHVMRHAQQSPLFGGDFAVDVQAVAAGAQGPAVRIDPRSRPTDEIVLRMPGSGSVVVEVRELDGTPLDPRYLQMRDIRLEPAEGHFTPGFLGWQCELGPDGTGRFPHVGLGQRLRAEFGTVGTVEFEGPRRPGEEIRAVLVDRGDGPILVGRLLLATDDEMAGQSAEPLADVDFGFSWESEGSSGNSYAHTDEEGGFRVRPGTWLLNAAATVSFASGRREERRFWRADLPVRAYEAGVNDLGVIVVQTLSPIGTGRITGIEEIAPATTRGTVRPADGTRRTLDPSRITFEPDGRFVIEGICEPDTPLQLDVQGTDFRTDSPVPFRAGATDLTVPVTATVTLSAHLRVDDPHTRNGLHCWLDPLDDDDRRPRRSNSTDLADELRPVAKFRDVPAGKWRLRVEHAATRRDLVTVDDLELLPGAPPDPRLADIDLRALVRTVHIRAVDAAGQPLVDGGVVFAEFPDDRTTDARFASSAAALVLTEPCTAWVVVPGHRIERLDDVFDDRSVGLQLAEHLDLRITCTTPWPSDLDAEVCLVPTAEAPRSLGRGLTGAKLARFQPLAKDGTVRLEVPLAGPNQVRMRLRRGAGRASWIAGTVDVDPDVRPLRATLELDAAEFAAVVAGLRND